MSNQTTTSRRHRRTALIPAAIVTAALLIVPAQGMASTSFGAKLTPDIQPSNANSAHPCTPVERQPCTRISMDGYGRPGLPKAPKKGTIKKIKLIAGEAGTFRFQLAKVRPGSQQAKVVRNGPVINYQGQAYGEDGSDPDAYNVETFKVNVKVKKGEFLAIKSTSTSMLRCSSGGPNQLLFQPPLALGNPFRSADDTDGCWLLLEAVIK
jgi:hypothetical protein